MQLARALALLLLVAFTLTCTTGMAFCEDKPAAEDKRARGAKKDKDYVSQLKDEELTAIKEMLAKRDMSWDALEPQTRNRIAFTVVRMRGMTEAERERFRGKLERIRSEEVDRKQLMGERLKDIRKDGGRARRGAQFIRISHVFFERMLGKDQRARFKQMGLPLLPFQVAVFERFKEHVGATDLADDELPEGMRKRLDKYRAKLENEQDPKRRARNERQYRRKAGHLRIEVFVRGLEKPTDKPARGAYERLIVKKLQERWPQAFEAARNDLSVAMDDPRMIRQILQTNQNRAQKQQQLFTALLQLEKTLPVLSSDEGLHKKGRMLFEGVLTRGFSVPKEAIDQYPVFLPRQDWRVRRAQVLQYLQKHGKLDEGFVEHQRRWLQQMNDRRKMRDRRRGPQKPGGKPARGGN